MAQIETGKSQPDNDKLKFNAEGLLTLNTDYLVPIGAIIPWHKNMSGVPSLPENFLEMNGQTVNDSDSPLNGNTLFNMNDVHSFVRGNATSGAVGGEATHTLTESEIPAHSHTISPTDYNASLGSYGATGSVDRSHSVETDSTGGGSAHNNEPQYINLVWIIRIK